MIKPSLRQTTPARDTHSGQRSEALHSERLRQAIPNASISDATRRNSIHSVRHRLLLSLRNGQREVLRLAATQDTYLQGRPDLFGIESFLQIGGID